MTDIKDFDPVRELSPTERAVVLTGIGPSGLIRWEASIVVYDTPERLSGRGLSTAFSHEPTDEELRAVIEHDRRIPR